MILASSAGEHAAPYAGNDDASRNTFTFYTKAGKVSSDPIRHRTEFLTWVPGTTTALMYDDRFHLIDWNTGKLVRDIPNPNPVSFSHYSVAVFGDHLLLGGKEYIKWGEHQKAVRSIYALEPKTGKVVAHWLSDSMDQATGDGGRFLQLGRKLFLVTDEKFAEVSLDDITAKKNGWK